jgi:glycosyltransferase involved in cell wall biosynthesis
MLILWERGMSSRRLITAQLREGAVVRIAIISEVFLPKIDGVVNRTLNLIRELVELGDDVLVVCPQVPGCSQCPVPVLGVPCFTFQPYPEYKIGVPDRRVVEGLKRFAPDVIHYINPFAFGFRCSDLLRRAGVKTPTVFSFHTLYGEFCKKYKALSPLSALLWWLTREYHNRADINLTVSSAMQQDLIQRGFERVDLWPPAVDTELFHPRRKSPAMRSLLSGGQPERPLLLTVSRLAPEKNVGFLAAVLEQFSDARLGIVGDGPQRAELERCFGSNATFVGYLKGADLATAYASADAFVYASETETMGNVVLEAMAAGCPVVAPDAGGIPSLLSHGETGFLFRPGDLATVVQLTRALLTDQQLHDRVAQAARRDVEGRAWQRSIARVRELYAEAARQPQRPPVRWARSIAQLTLATLVGLFWCVAPSARPARQGTAPERTGEVAPAPAPV